MDLHTAQNTLAVRLYEWAQRDFLRETEAGCPLLSMIGQHNRTIGGFVSWNRKLSSVEREHLAEALLRLNHRDAATLKGEIVTDENRSWGELCYDQTTIHKHQLPPLTTADRTLPTFSPVNTESCLQALLTSLSPAFGQAARRKSGVRCVRQIGDWKLVTEFTIEKRRENLYSAYQFIRGDDSSTVPPSEVSPRPRSLLAIYGLYSRTVVAVPSQADGEAMAKAMAKLTEHFLLHAETVLSGLGAQD